MFVRCSNSSCNILAAAQQNTQAVIDATRKETAIDEQQHNYETLIRQSHQTILRLLSSAAMARIRWRVRKLYCPDHNSTSISRNPAYVKYPLVNK